MMPKARSAMTQSVVALASGALLSTCVACTSSDSGNGDDSTGGSAGAASGGAGTGASSGGAKANSGGNGSGGATSNSGGTTSSGGNSSGGATSNSGGAAGPDGDKDGGAGTDGGSAPDPCKTARFCETFEGYDTGKAPAGGWKTQTNLGTVSVVETQKFAGSKSAKCTTQSGANGKTAYLRLDLASVFPVPNNIYFGRMMARLESAPETSVHWTFIQGGGLVPGQSYHSLYRYGGQVPLKNGSTFTGTQLMANYETPDSYGGTGPSSDCWNHSNGKIMPVAKWTCVEWQFDGPNDTMRFWLDGAPIDALTVQHTGQGCVHQDKTFEWKAPNFDHLELGWESYQQDSERTLYVDDVVIATTRVGCPSSVSGQ
jgi:hypothetical protein